MTPTITEAQVNEAMRSFLIAVLPAGTDAIIAQQNRVPEPTASNYVVMTPMRRPRLRTNVDSPADISFTASIAGTTLDVTAVAFGSIEIGATVFGTGAALNTVVVSQLTGSAGGVGTYEVSPSQTAPSAAMAAGRIEIEQGTEAVYQLDFHGPSSVDNAQVVSTLMRDPYGVDLFAGQSPAVAVPLHADDPRQMPFINDQQQYEGRWIVEAMLQINPVVSVPVQYADAVVVDVVSIDAEYAP